MASTTGWGWRAGGDRVLAAIGELVLRARSSRGVAVLAYHDVPSRDLFEKQLGVVAQHAQVITTSEVLSTHDDENAVCFTFDDGHRSVYEVAFPLLEERGWVATLYPVAGLVDSARPFWWDEVAERLKAGARTALLPEEPSDAVRHLKHVPDEVRRRAIAELRSDRCVAVRGSQLTWDEIRQLADRGWEIGNHSWSHPCLDRCAEEQIEGELQRAHDRLAAELGRQPKTLAYPNGNVDSRVRRIAAAAGYETAFLFDHRLARPHKQDPFMLSRIRADAAATVDRFTAVVSGVHPIAHHVVGRP